MFTIRHALIAVALLAVSGCGGEDADGDGFSAAVDCDDTDPTTNPEADEICDGWDNDCDGRADVDAVDAVTFYQDVDGDGFGDPNAPVTACGQTETLVPNDADCDDTSPAAHPGAVETCGATSDLNCDGSMGFDDNDQDGFAACEECNDALAGVNPDATEDCNGIDDDCDGQIDEGACNYTHDADIQPIWDNTCTARCHSRPAPSAGLDLERNGYAGTVNAPSGQANLRIITPGDLDGSYLVHKLRGTHLTVGGSGTSMPKTGSLAPTDLAIIEAWILDGCVER